MDSKLGLCKFIGEKWTLQGVDPSGARQSEVVVKDDLVYILNHSQDHHGWEFSLVEFQVLFKSRIFNITTTRPWLLQPFSGG